MSIDWIARARAANLRVCDFVDGRWQAERDSHVIEKYSPRDGQLLCKFGAADEAAVDAAVAGARHAFEDGRWSKLPVQRRKDVLYRLATLIEEHREELALLECLDVGKPIGDAFGFDIPAAAAELRFYAEAADKFYGRVYAVDQSSLSYQLRRPIGVVAGMIGWNFPLLLAIEKIGPALATGNSLILKPSELTSLSAARIAELAVEAGVPAGVLNVIHGGADVGAALVRHRGVSLVTFTGSTATGKKLLIAAGQSNLKKMILECGGKAPNIVFDDSPSLEAVADAVVLRAFRNQGQVCSASSRLLIQKRVEEEFLDWVVRKTSTWNLGDPLKEETRFGAVVSQAHRQKVLGYIESGEEEGARIAYRSQCPAPYEHGFYVGPVIFSGVSPTQRIAQEEIFGPVLSVITFDSENEAIRIANSTIYGLTAILWTKDLGRAHRVTQGIRAGLVVVNATDKPVGGPGAGVLTVGGHNQSGVGAEGGIQGLEAYTSETAVQLFV